MPNGENQPLLGHRSDPDEEPPTFISSVKVTATSSWFNVLLLFVPIALGFSFAGASDSLVFSLNFMAIIPLAKLLGFGKRHALVSLGKNILSETGSHGGAGASYGLDDRLAAERDVW